MRFDEAGLLSAFDAHRDLIYATAAKVYARSHRGSYDLVSTDFGTGRQQSSIECRTTI
jgi:hypothetical protein